MIENDPEFFIRNQENQEIKPIMIDAYEEYEG